MSLAPPWARLPGRDFPGVLLRDWLGAPAVSAGKYPGGKRGPGELWKGPQIFRKSLDKKLVCSGKCFAFFIFSVIGKPCRWIFFGSSFLLKMCTGTLGGGTAWA